MGANSSVEGTNHTFNPVMPGSSPDSEASTMGAPPTSGGAEDEEVVPIDADTQFIAVMSATLAAKIAMEEPSWLLGFEQAANDLAGQREPALGACAQFQRGFARCREILVSLGFENPAQNRVLILTVFAAQALATARSLRGTEKPPRRAGRPSRRTTR